MILSESACAIWGAPACMNLDLPVFGLPACLPALPTHESPTHDSIGFCPSLTLRDPAPPQPTFVPTVGVFVERLGVPEQWGGRPGGQPQSLCFYHRSATDCNTLLSTDNVVYLLYRWNGLSQAYALVNRTVNTEKKKRRLT